MTNCKLEIFTLLVNFKKKTLILYMNHIFCQIFFPIVQLLSSSFPPQTVPREGVAHHQGLPRQRSQPSRQLKELAPAELRETDTHRTHTYKGNNTLMQVLGAILRTPNTHIFSKDELLIVPVCFFVFVG